MIKIRPIDEELNSLHQPLAVTVSEDDNDVSHYRSVSPRSRIEFLGSDTTLELSHPIFFFQSALDGFRVTNSGSVMIPSGLTKPFIERATNAANGGSMYNQGPNPYHQDQYFQHNRHSQHIQQQQQQQQQLQEEYFYQQQYQQQLLQMQQQQFQQGFYSNSLPRSFTHHSAGYPRAMPSSLPASLPQYFSHQSFPSPQHLPHPGMSPLGMSPMGMAYSPMTH
jgi:hypothetical protein